MPMFASTTSSGYRDPLQALSIKALEQRQKDMLAQQAAAPGITAENTQQPVQAFGHIANQLADSLNVRRAESATAARRENLVNIMKQVDWEKGATSEQVALMHGADPELAGKILEQAHQNRQNIRTDGTQRYGYDKSLEGTRYTADSSRASHQYTTDVGARTAANSLAWEQKRPQSAAGQQWQDEQNAGPTSPLAGMTKRNLENEDKLKPKDAETLLKLSAADTQKEFLNTELNAAEKAIMHPGGINQGPTGFLAQGLTNVFGGTAGNKEKANRTTIYDNAMKRVATTNMANILSGPSTNFELQTFIKVYNDPNMPIERKREAFQELIQSTRHDRERSAEMLKKMGVTPFRSQQGPGSQAPQGPQGPQAEKTPEAIESERSMAQAAIDQGKPFEAVAKAFQTKGFDPSLLKQKAK